MARNIIFENGCDVAFHQAEEFIQEMNKIDEEKAKQMELSWHHCWDTLYRILFNAPVPKDQYGCEQGSYVLKVYPDFVKGSFGFTFMFNGAKDFNGGLILHGYEETLSVELVGSSTPYWRIHT